MYEFFVVRFTNRADGTTGNTVTAFKTEAEALKEFFRQCGKAVDSTHITDSVSLLSKEGFELRHEFFTHDAPAPTPEVVEEPTE